MKYHAFFPVIRPDDIFELPSSCPDPQTINKTAFEPTPVYNAIADRKNNPRFLKMPPVSDRPLFLITGYL
jgi:hypothetical protein